MTILKPKTPLEAVNMRKENPSSLYLLGGTEDLRLNGSANEDTVLIDVKPILSDKIEDRGDYVVVGAASTLERIKESDLLSSILREACGFCSSFEKRNAATIGGNVGARRSDSYLIAALSVLGATFHSVTPHGEEDKKVSDYANTACKRIITEFYIPKNKDGFIKRFGHTSTSHATLIAASCDGSYALSVSSSPFVFGNNKDIYKECEFVSDITGSAEYKKYLASIVFEEVK